MRKLSLVVLCIISIYAFGEEKPGTDVQIVNYNELKTIIQKTDNKLYVVNFWATWCKPCVEELPAFMEVNSTYKKNPRFEMILVSLDMAKELDSGVKPFIRKRNINTKVYLLNDVKKMNEWIPATDKNWTGAIPATVLYRNGKKLFFNEGELTKNELIKIINKHL